MPPSRPRRQARRRPLRHLRPRLHPLPARDRPAAVRQRQLRGLLLAKDRGYFRRRRLNRDLPPASLMIDKMLAKDPRSATDVDDLAVTR